MQVLRRRTDVPGVRIFSCVAAVALALSGCEGGVEESLDPELDLSALVQTSSGFHFHPPLAPTPTSSGVFDPHALDVLTVELQELDAAGTPVRTVVTLNRNTRPGLKLVPSAEQYFVNVRAASYITSRDHTYRFRVLGAGGRVLGFADLSDRVWEFLARYPELTIGVKLRVEVGACARIAPDSITDVCDGVDNDCDGTTDEDVTTCSDGNACTDGDACVEGACAGTPVVCPAIDDCHEPGTCDPATGGCTTPPKQDGAPCSYAGEPGVCASGVCTPSFPIQLFTAATAGAATAPANLGRIPAIPGKRIHVTRVAICGDADQSSGMQGFRAYDGQGLDFTWGAGQNNSGNATYVLAPTQPTIGAGRGFSYGDVSLYGAVGAPLTIDFQFRYDWDGRYCDATDTAGHRFTDPASSVRAWVRYQYVDIEGTTCDDGNPCTQTDIWRNGVCVGGNPVVCTASDQCHDAGTCNPATGQCTNPAKPNGAQCHDGNACTQVDSCQAGVCTGSSPVTCSPTAQCEASTCNPATGACVVTPAADGTGCTLASGDVGQCIARTCSDDFVFTAVSPAAATPVVSLGQIPALPGKRVQIVRIAICGDADATSGLQGFRAFDGRGLDFTWGAGQNNPNNVTYLLSPTLPTVGSGRGFSYRSVNHYGAPGAPVSVNFEYRNDWDGRFCQATDERGWSYTDAASTARAWVRYRYIDQCAIDGLTCDDGDACTRTDVCQGGACVGSSPVVCTALSQCHDVGTCDPTNGVCSTPTKADGTSCNDGTLCTETDSCVAGVCTGTDPVTCPDPDACNVGICDGATG
ncbi:hypothetical protein L6R52_38460, partial [Myxococcota bacterium]|nr:hypothetical protein [Myxococcota bacterium]